MSTYIEPAIHFPNMGLELYNSASVYYGVLIQTQYNEGPYCWCLRQPCKSILNNNDLQEFKIGLMFLIYLPTCGTVGDASSSHRSVFHL